MNLVSTLGKIAVGIAVAKGVGKLTGSSSGGSSSGLGGLLSGVLGGGSGGALGSALGGLLGGQSGQQSAQSRSASGGMGDLGALLGGKSGGGLAGDLGALLGGKGGSGLSGGLGGLLESISGGSSSSAQLSSGSAATSAPSSGSLGALLNSALQGETVPEPEPEQEDLARVLIQAMVNAAKSDGNIDQSEQQKILSNLGDEVSDAERDFVIGEMKAPLNLDAFIQSVPKGSEMQVYMMSILAIDLDSREEAQYLDKLRKGMGMSEQQANAIHEKLGVPTLYS